MNSFYQEAFTDANHVPFRGSKKPLPQGSDKGSKENFQKFIRRLLLRRDHVLHCNIRRQAHSIQLQPIRMR